MSEMQDRLKEKTLQIAQLQQKIEILQAQLQGTHRRSVQLGEDIHALEQTIASKNQEIDALKAELSRTRSALESVGKEIKSVRAEQSERLGRSKPAHVDSQLKDQITNAETIIDSQRESIRLLSRAATSVLFGTPAAIENLQTAVMDAGDPKYKILNLVFLRKSIRVDELASILLIDLSEAHEALDELEAAGEVEVKGEANVIPGRKYREITIPVEDWVNADQTFVFDSLEEVIGKMSDNEAISKALENAVDVLEQKLPRGGALIFQMRKTADLWSKKDGNKEELLYTIREWKGRASSLTG
ncbi:MAG: hypothetical protein EAX95_09435 [Candidatus Thorarchaeota archaeon]|nr:hypothetical protein [Candidatus Thorarchaeota archaeon]